MKRERHDQINSTNGEEEIAEVLRGLKQIAAPSDFEMRVSARIARGKPASGRGGLGVWAPIFRTAVPLLLLLGIAGIFIGSYRYSVDSDAVAVGSALDRESEVFEQVASEVRSENFAEPALNTVEAVEEIPAGQRFSDDRMLTVADNTAIEASNSGPIAVPSAPDDGSTTVGGSFDSALSTSNKSILPPGISRSPRIRIESDNLRRPITAERILRQIGIDAELSGSKWIAKAVRENSPADRSGIRAGDAIVAVDGRILSGETVFSGIFTGKTLKVSRDGNELFIDIR